MNQQRKISVTKLLPLLAAFLVAPCYSEYEFGYSNPVPDGSSSWGMSRSVFPVPALSGVDINGVFYRYTAVKDPNDPYTVSVQNQAADGSGYIFRSTDDWSGGGGGTIQKFIPLPYSPLGDWGDGEIEQVGIGNVEDPVVLYSYRYDPSRVQPEIDFNLFNYDPYDPLSDQYVLGAIEPTDPELYEFEEKSEESSEDDRIETALAASENALTMANNVTQNGLIKAMNIATNIRPYYDRRIAGGVYQETVVLIDKKIPDNRKAFRSLSQDRVHKQMVDSQY
jgi:hypothetical protein